MRIRISHSINYSYAEPARQVTQILRLTPRDHDGQHVMSWRIDPNVDGRLRQGQDAFGNIVHTFSAEGAISALAIRIEGVVETSDLAGILRGTIERVPPEVFLRDTRLTAPDDHIRGFALAAVAGAADPLSRMHALMEALHAEIACDSTGTSPAAGASAAFAERAGVPQDIAHLFIACARHLEVPARYVSGYVADNGRLAHAGRGHAWAEAHVEGYGWIGFDCANGLCPIDTHVRVAAGLDFADAAPVRGARHGGDGETLAMVVEARAAAAGIANQ